MTTTTTETEAVCIRTFPAQLMPGDILFTMNDTECEVIGFPKDLGFNTIRIETSTGTDLYPANYRDLYRIERAN